MTSFESENPFWVSADVIERAGITENLAPAETDTMLEVMHAVGTDGMYELNRIAELERDQGTLLHADRILDKIEKPTQVFKAAFVGGYAVAVYSFRNAQRPRQTSEDELAARRELIEALKVSAVPSSLILTTSTYCRKVVESIADHALGGHPLLSEGLEQAFDQYRHNQYRNLTAAGQPEQYFENSDEMVRRASEHAATGMGFALHNLDLLWTEFYDGGVDRIVQGSVGDLDEEHEALLSEISQISDNETVTDKREDLENGYDKDDNSAGEEPHDKE